jgi:hypothetical protein
VLILSVMGHVADSMLIDCNFRMMNFALIGEVYTCEPTIYMIADYPNIVYEIRGTHLPGKSNAHVEGLFITFESQFHSIPYDLGNYFPNLRGLDIAVTPIYWLSKSQLSQFPYLNILIIQYNRELRGIDSNAFTSNRQLRQITLNSNDLRYVGSNLFQNLIYLDEVFMFDNYCINEQAIGQSAIQNLNNILPTRCPFPP